MSRKLVVEIIGDASSLDRSLKQATVASNRFGKEVSHSLRGVASGTGIMHNFGRSLAFASGGFLAFEGASKFLTDSISAAREAGVAQRSLAAQMKASGESFQANREQIDKAALSYGKFGFQNDEVIASLVVLERGTGKINQAIQLQGVTADLARAKNIDLAAAANVVAKVFGGQETALRRAVPGLEKNAHGIDLIREAQQKLAGQAAANTTVSERFAATLHDTEEIVGRTLLPILNQYLTSLSKWLDGMNQTGQLQKDVAGAVKLFTEAVGLAKGVVDTLNRVTGSTTQTLKLLFAALVAFKTARFVGTFTEIAGGVARVGTNAETSTGKVQGLSGALGGLKGLGPQIGITVLIEALVNKKPIDDWLKSHHLGVLTKGIIPQIKDLITGGGGGPAVSREYFVPRPSVPFVPPFVPHDLPTGQAAAPILGRGALTPMQRAQLAESAAGLTKTTADNLKALVTQRVLLAKAIRTETARLNQATTADAAKSFADNLQKLQDNQAAVMGRIAEITQKGAQTAKRTGAEIAQQRNTWFDTAIGRMLDRVQDIPTLQGQIAKLKTIGGLIQKQIQAARDITRKQTLGDQLAQVYRSIKSDQDQITQNAADAAQAAAQRQAATQQALLDRLQYNVDRTGLTDSLSDDLKALRAQQATIEKIIRTQGSTLQLQQQLLSVELAIKSKNQEIADARKARLDAAKQATADAEQSRLDWAQLAVDRAGLTDTLTDDLKATQKQLAINSQLISVHGKTLALEQQRVGFLQAIKNLRQQQADQAKKAADATDKAATATDKVTQSTRKLFRHLNATAFVNQFGANLTREQKRRLEIGLAMTGPGGTLPAGHSGQFTAGVTINGGVHMHGVQDVPGLENQIAKRAKARPHVRRGARG